MASATHDSDRLERVELVREDDGTITARDLETGLARGGDTRAEALALLAEVLELHQGGGEPIDDPDVFLREELEINPDEVEAKELPDFLRRRSMARWTSSGPAVISVLRSFGYRPVSRSRSRVRLRYENPDTGEVRNVDVPMPRVEIGTLRFIADQRSPDISEA